MTSISSLRAKIERLKALVESKRIGPQRKPTTFETRQELDRILAKLENLPADASPHPDTRGLAEARAEIDRVLAVMDARDAT